jgi:ribosomal protein L11 methyltransferase
LQWLEVKLNVKPEAVEAIADILRTHGATNGVEISEAGELTAYYPQDKDIKTRLAEIQKDCQLVSERLGYAACGKLTTHAIDESEWANVWKEYFHVTHLGKHLVIQPAWEEYQPKPQEIVLKIDPGMAFGSGSHQTTALCMEALEKLIKPQMTVFDVGTGTGILAMTTAKLGAASIKAVDISSVAVKTATENVAKSGLADKIKLRQGDLLHGTDGKADIIVANLLADIVKMLLPDVPGKLAEGGVFLASGILKEQQDEVAEAAAKQGLHLVEVTQKDDWIAMIFKGK